MDTHSESLSLCHGTGHACWMGECHPRGATPTLAGQKLSLPQTPSLTSSGTSKRGSVPAACSNKRCPGAARVMVLPLGTGQFQITHKGRAHSQTVSREGKQPCREGHTVPGLAPDLSPFPMSEPVVMSHVCQHRQDARLVCMGLVGAPPRPGWPRDNFQGLSGL